MFGIRSFKITAESTFEFPILGRNWQIIRVGVVRVDFRIVVYRFNVH